MYAVKGWAEFQHYKDRNPPWLKLHRSLLDDLSYFSLSPPSAKILPLIWILASEKNGIIPSTGEVAFRLRIPIETAAENLLELVNAGFLRPADEAEVVEQHATPAQKAGWGSRHIPDSVKRAVWQRDDGKCQECGISESIEYDHKHPVSAGGSSEISNVQLLCRPCNRRKRTGLGRRSPETENRGRGQRQRHTNGGLNGKPKSWTEEGDRLAEHYRSQGQTGAVD